MKKILLIAVLLAAMLSGCTTKKDTLKVFNWGVYVDESVVKDFEKKFNVRVIYDTFESNEAMYTKLQGGEYYDVLVPSDYMIERLIVEGKLQKIDMTKIPNTAGLISSLTKRPFDPKDEYSVPYFWGNVGLVYNNENVALSDLETEGWKILADTKYKGKVYIYDSERDAFMIASKTLGYSANSDNAAEVQAAFEFLSKINSTMDPVYVTDDAIDNMISGVKDIAVMYSGDAAYIVMENDKMSYFVPQEGTNVWVDSMVIPTDAKNVALAHEWINYMLDPAIALKNTEFVGYTTPVQSVYDQVTTAGGTYEGIDAYSPRLDNPLDESFRHNEELKKTLSTLWTKIKAE